MTDPFCKVQQFPIDAAISLLSNTREVNLRFSLIPLTSYVGYEAKHLTNALYFFNRIDGNDKYVIITTSTLRNRGEIS